MKQDFFQSMNIPSLVGDFVNVNSAGLPNKDKKLCDGIVDFFHLVLSNPKLWDDLCQYSIYKYGGSFKDALEKIPYSTDVSYMLLDISVALVSFYEEFKYWSDDVEFNVSDHGFYYVKLLNLLHESDISDTVRVIQVDVQTHALRKVFQRETIFKINEEIISRDAIFTKIDELNVLLEAKTSLIKALSEKIVGLENRYNFVGLHQGFEKIYQSKCSERRVANVFVYCLAALLLLVPILIALSFIMMESVALVVPDSENNYFWEMVRIGVGNDISKIIIPLISMEVVLLYFFRLKYMEVKSIGAQILQVHVRMSLCQFIQSYSEYSLGFYKESPDLLSRFESVIFSPIVATEADIPSSLDGVTQLLDIVAKIKK